MSNRGNTYVEIIVSLFILGLIVPLLINVFQFADMECIRARESLELSYIVQAYIEDTLAEPLSVFNMQDHKDKMKYKGYFFDRTIKPYWNGNSDVTYYIIGQTEQDYSIDIYGSLEDSSYLIINAMKYGLQQDIYIDGQSFSHLDQVILYCTKDNLDKIHITGFDHTTIVLDSKSREKMIFLLSISVFEGQDDMIPILSMETLIDKEI